MPNRSSALSRSTVRWALQIATSVGASLLAALIVQALPRLAPEAPAPMPELTSGGKFAARVEVTRAYDGLDIMPLPTLEAPRVAAAPVGRPAFAAASADLAGLGTALRQPGVDGLETMRERVRSIRPVHTAVRSDPRRLGAPTDAPLRPTASRDATPLDGADGGLLHEVASRTRQVWSTTSATTRDAWSATASVGASLVSRLAP